MKTRAYLGLSLALLIAISIFFWQTHSIIKEPNTKPITTGPKTSDPVKSVNKSFSYGRVDECCFKGWAYDEDKVITYSFTLENIDYPEIKRTFTRTNTEPQTEFYFANRDDVRDYLQTQGVTKIEHKVAFTFSPQEPLYPGRYRLSAATYNGKPLDTTPIPKGPLFTAAWTGGYERRYNPIRSQEYIERQDNFDTLYDQISQKRSVIKPRQDLISTSNAQWSPNAKYIAYTYSATPEPNFSPAIFNTLSPDEVRGQKYTNPNRVLLGGDALRYSWLDNSRIVVIELIGKQTQDYNLRSYTRATIQIYNADTEQFEHPMDGYISNVHDAYISPDRKKFLFDISEEGATHSYLVTDIAGAELRRMSSYNDNWYNE